MFLCHSTATSYEHDIAGVWSFTSQSDSNVGELVIPIFCALHMPFFIDRALQI
jgi:hypothetical protein